ncbi:unnamed protein product [Blepharisma stoltei]|uniref:Uncharacterized protein n=1 Tax=Blepharisma stoltei TaxID=1481888 RepID=A0AAU9IJG8_9CILI|nr:unnamed protein product [Blepharisma stoltei]
MSLFVGNISRNISLKDLEAEFNKFGVCKINHKGGYAFIEYSNERDAEDAMFEMLGKNMGGLCLNIEWSKRSDKFNPKALSKPNPSKDRQKDKCFNCGKPGHISRDCAERVECFECGAHGHFARGCPNGKKSSPKKNSVSPHRSRSPRKSSSERSFSIERGDLPEEFFPKIAKSLVENRDFYVKQDEPHIIKEEIVDNELTMEDGSKFTLISGGFNEESAVFRCALCSKNLQKSSARRHIGTKTHKERLIKVE